MSGRIVGEILEHAPADLTQTQLIVLVALGESARERDRRAVLGSSVADLTRRTRCSPGSIRNALSALARRNLIQPVYKRVHKGGRHQEYLITKLAPHHRGATFEPTDTDAHTQRFPPAEETGP